MVKYCGDENKVLGATAACTYRDVNATKGCGQDAYEEKEVCEVFYRDSWFLNFCAGETVFKKADMLWLL